MGLPARSEVSSSESWDTPQEFKVQLMGPSAAILYRLMAAILRRPHRRGPGIHGDPSDPLRLPCTSVRVSSIASPEKSRQPQEDTN